MPFRPFSRDTVYLMPPVLDDWVAADHPVRCVAAFVAALTDAEWTQMGIPRTASGRGAAAYHPEVLVGAWLAGFMLGIRSSRALAAACRDLVPLRWWEPSGHRQSAARP